MNKKPLSKNKRAVAAMSGGVDSAVAAALLVEKGYEVLGITLQLYNSGSMSGKAGTCCAGRDIADARRVAQHLNIPHYVLDFEARFKESVIDDFADTYLSGQTPVPCIRCNEKVKFTDLLNIAKDLGADMLATGHYVRKVDGPHGPELHTASDSSRDQSYFMFTTTKEQLSYLHFPLGNMDKEKTRLKAKQLGLPVAEKPDSQDICFVPNGSYVDTISRLRPNLSKSGNIVHIDGQILGRHAGLIHFTVGQRKGLNIGGGQPYYVVRLDSESGNVYVGPRESLGVSNFYIRNINWLAKELTSREVRAEVRVRSTRNPKSASIYLNTNGAEVILDDPEEGVAPGQACVIYDGSRVLGGGWISSSDTSLT